MGFGRPDRLDRGRFARAHQARHLTQRVVGDLAYRRIEPVPDRLEIFRRQQGNRGLGQRDIVGKPGVRRIVGQRCHGPKAHHRQERYHAHPTRPTLANQLDCRTMEAPRSQKSLSSNHTEARACQGFVRDELGREQREIRP
jgi:hypothetical protein